MMKRRVLFSILLVASMLLFACSDGEESSPGDSESGDGDSESTEGKAFGEACVDNEECAGQICFQYSTSLFCTQPCASDSECNSQQIGACCMTVEGQNLCMPITVCDPGDIPDPTDGDTDNLENPTDGDFPDGDGPVDDCEPNEVKCQGTWILRCNTAGNAWEAYLECVDGEYCEDGQCKVPVDGDIEDDVENTCGDPTIIPGPLLKRAEAAFRKDESTPPELAEIYESLNPAFEDDTYVKLSATGTEQELVFDVDVDFTHEYYFIMDYVCGSNWGQAAMYLDDDTEPMPLYQGALPDRIDLDCTPEFGLEEQPLKKIAYETLCIEEGEHKLHIRVIGKNQNSDGYAIGVDYMALLPKGDDTEE